MIGFRLVCAAIGVAAGQLPAAGDALASGFQLTEQSVAGMGRAYAGAGVAGDDASAAFYNPAAMTLLDGTQMNAGLYYVLPTARFRGASSFADGLGGDAGVDAPIPSLALVAPVGERARLGLSVNAPFGLTTEYDRGWVGRFHALESDLMTVDLNPSLAYRLGDHLSVGAGFSVQYAEATLSQATLLGPGVEGVAEVTGEDWSAGYNLGLMYEVDTDTRLGLGYRSKVPHRLEGELNVFPPGSPALLIDSAHADLELPETAYLTGHSRLDERWSLSGTLRWTRWSRFDELAVELEGGASPPPTPQRWEDTWAVGLGLDFEAAPAWTLRAGYAFDESPIPSAELRTPRIPDSDRHWLAIGATYRASDRLMVDFAYAHLFFADGPVDTTTTVAPGVEDRLSGEYESGVDVFGIQLKWAF